MSNTFVTSTNYHRIKRMEVERRSTNGHKWINVDLYTDGAIVSHVIHMERDVEIPEIHDWGFVPPTVEMPQVGSYWIHEESGEYYVIAALANIDLLRDPKPEETNKFPPTIIYTHASGRTYSRVAHEWVKNFQPATVDDWQQACSSHYREMLDQTGSNIEQLASPSGESHGPDQDSQSPSPDWNA